MNEKFKEKLLIESQLLQLNNQAAENAAQVDIIRMEIEKLEAIHFGLEQVSSEIDRQIREQMQVLTKFYQDRK